MPIYRGEEHNWRYIYEQAPYIRRTSECIGCGIRCDYNRVVCLPTSHKEVVLCGGCFENYMKDTMYPPDDDTYNYFNGIHCQLCGHSFGTPYYNTIYWLSGNIICEDCYSEHGIECYICGYRYEAEELYPSIEVDGWERYICQGCVERGHDVIMPYSYNPKFKFYKTNRDNKTVLYLGIELEVESGNKSINEQRQVIKSLPEFVYVKADSSISNGFEIVSHPATYNWLLGNKDKWEEILNLRKSGWRSYDTETCGMHIHLSKNAFGNYHLYKFMKLFYDNEDFTVKFSQRVPQHLRAWASTKDNEGNIKYKAKHKSIGRENRHTAINLSRSSTVEIRIFRGTLCPPSFWKNIEFTKATYDFSRDNKLCDMNEQKFREYIRFKRKEYPNLHNFAWGTDKKIYSVER